MRILTNTTSPYARIARIALAEKGFDISGAEVVNPWDDPAELLRLNPAARVPTLELDDGAPLTETLLILMWLEKTRPNPTLFAADLARDLSQAGCAMGAIDAMAHIVMHTLHHDPGYGESAIGLRRRRSTVEGVAALEADPPTYDGGTPTVATITAVVARDYLRLRFPDAAWAPPTPRLDALSARLAERPSFAATAPYIASAAALKRS